MDIAENNPGADLFELFFGGNKAGSELFNRINDQVPSIIYIYNINKKKIDYINKKVTDVLGYSFSEINNWTDHLSPLIFKDDAELVEKEIAKLYTLKDSETHTYNNRLNHKQGHWRYFRTTGSVLRRNENGDAAAFLFVAEDITQSLETEEEIKTKKELVKETEELLQFGTWTWDMTTNTLTCSDGLLNLYGYTPKEVEQPTGDFFIAHMKQADADSLLEKIEKLVETDGNFEHVYTITTKNNQEKIVSTKGRAVKSKEGPVIKLVGTSRDVTEQTNAYRELFYYRQMTLEKEEFLESGSWEYDINTKKLSWSEGMFRLFDIKAEPANDCEIETTKQFYFSHLLPLKGNDNSIEALPIIEGMESYVRNTVLAKASKNRQLETYGKVIKNSDGIPIKLMGTTKDVTQLKEYELELEKKLSDLERSNRELEEFAYVASHDLQEPLRKISTFGERLSIKFADRLEDDGRIYLQKMLTATGNMRSLIDSLLEFSRLTSKAGHFDKSDLNTILEAVKAEIELELEETGTLILAESLPILKVIPSQIKQLFNNILLNAIKFRKDGIKPVIKIACSSVTEDEKVKYALRPEVNFYEIKIADNGIGFEPEYAERIFQLFQRLHAKSEYPGAGIGLAICRKIMDNHHGKIFAVGKPDEGATFILLLPEINN